MTIYTPSQNDKDKVKLIPEVVTESAVDIKDVKDKPEVPGRSFVEVTYFRRNGRSFYVHLLFGLAVVGILACGALGAVVFYRHLHKTKVTTYSGKCGTIYFDTTYHDQQPSAFSMINRNKAPVADDQMDFVEEDITVEDYFEEIHTPAFDEVRENFVLHDFKMNYSAIVDHRYRQCFVLKLNRTAIAPPTTVIERLQLTIKSKPYLQRAAVIRQDYEIVYILNDLTGIGDRIARDCANYPTQWLDKKVTGVFKRSAEKITNVETDVVYSMFSNELDKQVIYKMSIHGMKRTIEDTAK